MTYEMITAEWDAKIEAAAQAVVNGKGTEADVEAVMNAASDAIFDFLDGQP